MPDAFIYDAVRTPRGRGKPDGSLHEVSTLRLAETALRAIRDRNELDTTLVDDVVLGCVDPVGEAGSDIARAATLVADYGDHVPGVQINGARCRELRCRAGDVRPGADDHRRRRRVDEPRRHGRGGRRVAGRSAHRHQVVLHAAGHLGRPHRHEVRLLPR
jgi:hypothetical protein